MRNNLGQVWGKRDYMMATIAVIVLLVAISIPAAILIVFDYFTEGQYHWYAWSTLMILILGANFWLIFRRF